MLNPLPIKNLTSVPVQTRTLNATDTFLSVNSENETVRVTFQALSAAFPLYSATIPSMPTAMGTQGQLAMDAKSFYVYSNGLWGKIPRYTSDWDSIDSSTRYLPISRTVSLSDEELKTVYANLKLALASPTAAGTVQLTDPSVSPVEKGCIKFDTATSSIYVPASTGDSLGTVKLKTLLPTDTPEVPSAAYLENQLAGIGNYTLPAATTAQLGGVRASSSISIDPDGIASVPTATATTEGIVYVTSTPYSTAQRSFAVAGATMETYIGDQLQNVNKIATSSSPGILYPDINTLSPFSLNSAGLLTIRKGSAAAPGIFYLVSSITATGNASTTDVPSAAAVKAYVDALKGAIPDVKDLTVATTQTKGVIKASNSLRVALDGTATVPMAASSQAGIVTIQTTGGGDTRPTTTASVTYVEKYVNDKIAGVSLTIPTATSSVLGCVNVVPTSTDPNPFTVPTLAYVNKQWETLGVSTNTQLINLIKSTILSSLGFNTSTAFNSSVVTIINRERPK